MDLFNKICSFFITHKKFFLLFFIFILVFILLLFLQLVLERKENEDKQVSPKEQKSVAPSVKNNTFNPLINNTEKQRVKEAVQKRFENLEIPHKKKKDIRFNLKLSPKLKKQSAFAIPKAYAVSECNIDLAPATVSVYTIKSNYSENDAKVFARLFGFSNNPTSIPMVDGSSYIYNFLQSTSGVSSAYFTLSAPSGMYTYHKSFKPYEDTTDIGKLKAKTIAEDLLKKNNIGDKLLLTNIEEDTHMDVKLYTFTYIKEYGNFPFSDNATIYEVSNLSSVCSISRTSAMNTVQINITSKGELETFINKIRKVDKTSEVKRQSLSDAVEEYEREYIDNPPVDPIITGDIENVNVGEVSLELTEAQLIWYDYGENYAQKFYVPMYLTSGTIEGVRVFILIPAVAKENLFAIPDVALNNKALQFDVYYPPPPTATPVPPTNTPAPGVTIIPYVPSDGNYCYGNQIDYYVTCSSTNGDFGCSGSGAAPASSDPFNICTGSCKEIKAETITFSRAGTSSSACEAFLKKSVSNATMHGATSTSNGTYYCQIRGCPC